MKKSGFILMYLVACAAVAAGIVTMNTQDSAHAWRVMSAPIGSLDIQRASVVTNVNFSGLATTDDVADAIANIPQGTDEETVREIIQAKADEGLKKNGYEYVHLDGTYDRVWGIKVDIADYAIKASSDNEGNDFQGHYATKTELETAVATAGKVQSVNGKEGAVVLAAADVGAADQTSFQTVSNNVQTIGSTVQAWTGYWGGDDFRVTVTNYPTVAGASFSPSGYRPMLSMAWKTTDEKDVEYFQEVWNQAWLEDYFKTNYLPGAYYNKSEINTAFETKADTAWGKYDSETGEETPANTVQISSGNIILSEGMSFRRKMSTGGTAFWVLCGNYTSGANTSATNGTFALYDVEGNPVIQAFKGDKQVIGASADAVTTDNSTSPDTLVINYNVEGDQPILYVTERLEADQRDWKPETDPDCAATVVWSGQSGAWVARATPKNASATTCFAYAMYEAGGESYIDIPYNVRRMKIGDTLYTLGTTTVNGETVLKLTPVAE